jgi:hypothetical protein
MRKVIFKNQEYRTITALAKSLDKTLNQIFNHMDAGTPVLGHEPHCVDYALEPEDFLELQERITKRKQ